MTNSVATGLMILLTALVVGILAGLLAHTVYLDHQPSVCQPSVSCTMQD